MESPQRRVISNHQVVCRERPFHTKKLFVIVGAVVVVAPVVAGGGLAIPHSFEKYQE